MEEVKNLNTADQVLNYFKLSTWPSFKENVNTLSGWIFRGHKEATWKLIPNAFRFDKENKYTNLLHYVQNSVIRENKADYTLEQLDNSQLDYEDLQLRFNRHYLNQHRALEAQAVYDFVLMADRLGIDTSLDSQTAFTIKEIKEVISLNANVHYIDIKEELKEFPHKSLLESFALAQHHGVPTRLLDWTQQPLVALYFACKGVWDDTKNNWPEKVVHWEKELTDDSFMAIWAFNADRYNEINEPRIKIFSAAYSRNGYLKAQSGVFTLDIESDYFFSNNAKWPSQDEILAPEFLDYDFYNFRKIYVKKSLAKEILKKLFVDNNLSPVHISPSLDKIMETHQYHHELFRDYKI